MNTESYGRTIQLFLVDGNPSGLIIASIHGWTGSVLVSSQSTFGQLLTRPELNRTGVYILFGPDSKNRLANRAYIGEADSILERIDRSAAERAFWEIAVVITTSDEALTKGHVRYLEARLLELTKSADRVLLDNGQHPESARRRLPEADRANMEAFLANLRIILPVVGLDLLKPQPTPAPPRSENSVLTGEATITEPPPVFEIRHKSGIKAIAIEVDGEFMVLGDSQARKDTGHVQQSYGDLKRALIEEGILSITTDGATYAFTRPYVFKSPSAAAAVVLDRNSNGRTEWKLVGSKLNYHEWQERNSKAALPSLR